MSKNNLKNLATLLRFFRVFFIWREDLPPNYRTGGLRDVTAISAETKSVALPQNFVAHAGADVCSAIVFVYVLEPPFIIYSN